MSFNNFVDPRHDIWLKTANMLKECYLSSTSNVDWNALKKNIPSASKERVQKITEKINNSENLNKGERIFLIMLKLLNDEPVNNGAEILKQLQNHICEIETTFVHWEIVLENQKRNHHESEKDPMKLAELYRTDATQRAIQDAMVGIPPQQRDQFYRGIMKPPSETASRRNVFPGKALYGLTEHLVIVDENTGAIQIQQAKQKGCWFDKEYLKSMPNHPYEFQKPGYDGKNVWDSYKFNEAADISQKKS